MSLRCNWEFLMQEEVLEENMIPLPEPIKETVGFEGLGSPMVWWSREENHGLIVLSNNSLSEAGRPYETLQNTSIYDVDSVEEEGGRIRPPDAIAENEMDIATGDRVFYLMHEEMQRGKGATEQTGSVYLLPEDMILKLLPSKPGKSRPEASDFQEGLFRAPGFTDA
jgi:hypothetical protein